MLPVNLSSDDSLQVVWRYPLPVSVCAAGDRTPPVTRFSPGWGGGVGVGEGGDLNIHKSNLFLFPGPLSPPVPFILPLIFSYRLFISSSAHLTLVKREAGGWARSRDNLPPLSGVCVSGLLDWPESLGGAVRPGPQGPWAWPRPRPRVMLLCEAVRGEPSLP